MAVFLVIGAGFIIGVCIDIAGVMPAAAATSRPAEKAPVTSAGSQPVPSLIGLTAATKA